MGRETKQWPVGITERQLADGTRRFQLAFSYRGKSFRKLMPYPVTKQNAKYLANLRATIYTEIANGTFRFDKYWPGSTESQLYDGLDIAHKTLDVLLDELIADIRQTEALEAGTADNYEEVCTYILKPAFGHLRLVDLTPDHIDTWIKRQKVRQSTIEGYLRPLRRIIKPALRNQQITADPTANLDYRKLIAKRNRKARREDEDINPFTLEEVRHLHERGFPWTRHAFLFNCFTGLRVSELLALRWESVDLKKRRAYIKEARDRKGREKGTKTDKDRVIELRGPALQALQDQWAYQGGQREFVLTTKYGEPFANFKKVYQHWEKLYPRLDIPYRSPYQMRHTFASLMLKHGENILWVAHMMGHTDLTMLQKHYAKWIDEPGDEFETRNDWSRLLFSDQNHT